MTPVSAILTTSTLIALAIIFLDVVKIAKLASAFKVLMFIFNELTVIVLRKQTLSGINQPLNPQCILCTDFWNFKRDCIASFWGVMPVVSVIGVVILGFLIFLVYGSKSDRSGVASSYGLSFLEKMLKNQRIF